MSLLAFQRALADLAASPDLCRAVRADAEQALAGRDLTPLEHRRVASAAAQHGMVVNCTLHRSNRISTIITLLPITVHLLGKALRETADRFWAEHPVPDFTTRREIRRFSGWVQGEVRAGRIDSPFLPEMNAWELAQYELGMMPHKRTLARVAEDAERWPGGPLALHPLVRIVAFVHDPAVLLGHATRRDPLPWPDIATGEFYRLLDARDGRRVAMTDEATGRVLVALQSGAPVPPAWEADLLSAGVLVRTAPVDAVENASAEAELAGAA